MSADPSPFADYIARFPEQEQRPIPGSPFVPTHPMAAAMKYLPYDCLSLAELREAFSRLESAARKAIETGRPITDWDQFYPRRR